jgi:hypothetical protein
LISPLLTEQFSASPLANFFRELGDLILAEENRVHEDFQGSARLNQLAKLAAKLLHGARGSDAHLRLIVGILQ